MSELPIINKETEKRVLASLIKFPKIIDDHLHELKGEFFASDGHQLIFRAIESLAESNKTVDRSALAEHFHNLNLKKVRGVDLMDYVDSIYELYDLAAERTIEYIDSLKKYHIARKAYEAAQKLQREIVANLNLPKEELISLIHANSIDFQTSDICESLDSIDLYAEARQILMEDREEEKGIRLPFPLFESRFGPLRPKHCYAVIGTFGSGKSSFIDFVGKRCLTMEENNLRVLYIDTELDKTINVFRMAAGATGKNEHIFSSGQWRSDEDVKDRVFKMLDNVERKQNRYNYINLTTTGSKELISVIRRWHRKHVQHGEQALVIFDYCKILGEDIKSSWDEYNILGLKVQALHELARELNICVLFAAQANSEGGIAASKRILHFASNAYLLRTKTVEELQEYSDKWGTHCLEPIKTRIQGSNSYGFGGKIKVPVQGRDKNKQEYEYRENFINFNISNFKVKEMGDLQEILNKQAGGLSFS